MDLLLATLNLSPGETNAANRLLRISVLVALNLIAKANLWQIGLLQPIHVTNQILLIYKVSTFLPRLSKHHTNLCLFSRNQKHTASTIFFTHPHGITEIRSSTTPQRNSQIQILPQKRIRFFGEALHQRAYREVIMSGRV